MQNIISQNIEDHKHSLLQFNIQKELSSLPISFINRLKRKIYELYGVSDFSLSDTESLSDVLEYLNKEIRQYFKKEILTLSFPKYIEIEMSDSVNILIKHAKSAEQIRHLYWKLKYISQNYIDWGLRYNTTKEDVDFLTNQCMVQGIEDRDLLPANICLKPTFISEFNYEIKNLADNDELIVIDFDGDGVKLMNNLCEKKAKKRGFLQKERALGDFFIKVSNQAICDIKSDLKNMLKDSSYLPCHNGGDESLGMIRGKSLSFLLAREYICLTHKIPKKDITPDLIKSRFAVSQDYESVIQLFAQEYLAAKINQKLSRFSWGVNELKFSCRAENIRVFTKKNAESIQSRHISAFGVSLTDQELERYQGSTKYSTFIEDRIASNFEEEKEIKRLDSLSWEKLKSYMLKLCPTNSREYTEFIRWFGCDTSGELFIAKRKIFIEERKLYINKAIKERSVSFSGLSEMINKMRVVSFISSYNALKVVNAMSYPAGNLTIELNALVLIKRFLRNFLKVGQGELENVTISNWRNVYMRYKSNALPDELDVDLVVNGLDYGLVVFKKRGKNISTEQEKKISEEVQAEIRGTEAVEINTKTDIKHNFVFSSYSFAGKYNGRFNFREFMNTVQGENINLYMESFLKDVENYSLEQINQTKKSLYSSEKKDLIDGDVDNIDVFIAHILDWNNRSEVNIDGLCEGLYNSLSGMEQANRLIDFELYSAYTYQEFSSLKRLQSSYWFAKDFNCLKSSKILLFASILVKYILDKKYYTPSTLKLASLFQYVSPSKIEGVLPMKDLLYIHDIVHYTSGFLYPSNIPRIKVDRGNSSKAKVLA